jgi:hypothetical protein
MAGMGAWGAGIFADDTTSDVRDDYRERVAGGDSDAEATSRVIAHHLQCLPEDERYLLWLGLAAAQCEVGRLTADVRDRALQVIDDQAGLEPWRDIGGGQLRARLRALERLRIRLTGPQVPPRRPRRAWDQPTDLVQGLVLVHAARNGRMTLWRVARIEAQGRGRTPVLQQLAWDESQVPDEKAQEAPALPNLLLRSKPVTCVQVIRLGRTEPDWPEAGFAQVADSEPRPDDERVRPRDLIDWKRMDERLNTHGRLPNGWH